MIIDEIRIYAEVLEQGRDFCDYIRAAGYEGNIVNVYTKKTRAGFAENDSIIDRIRKVKDVDVLISAISGTEESPLLIVEYSTAVPTDDHKMQRSDVYYWSAVFRVPMLKISPKNKGMRQDFGGGDKITDEQEQVVAFNRGTLFFPVKWETPEGSDILPTKGNCLSCIPHNDEITNTISLILTSYNEGSTYEDFYGQITDCYNRKYADLLGSRNIRDIKNRIANSERFHWYGSKLSVKINRFGHAMDPDRGILYYANMLVGTANTITEFQVNRPDIDGRGGYNALFDGINHKSSLINYVERIIENKNNQFSDKDALHVLIHGLNIENAIRLEKIRSHYYSISDENLATFLESHPSMSTKSIFYLSTELKLTDKNRNVICSIRWNEAPIRHYLERIKTDNRTPLIIRPLSINKVKEDIVTYASVELYKKLSCDLLAVSYPGAQGDRCILTGSGRGVLRTYVDIIAYKTEENGIKVFLQECKDSFSKSRADAEKLNRIICERDKREGLKLLFRKTVNRDDIINQYISIAAKETRNMPQLGVDYIYMFNISNDEKYTYIDYTVAVINTLLVPSFLPLANADGRLEGRMQIDCVYVVE